jgi:hypothetical protein
VHWIEQVLGFSPDGGNGTLEIAIVLFFAGLAAAGAGFGLRARRASVRGRRAPGER